MLESSTVASNRQILTENLTQSQRQEEDQVMQLETASANYRQPELLQQSLATIGEFVEHSSSSAEESIYILLEIVLTLYTQIF